ncbi:MAG: OmpA family protein [Gammaproteobacteria bacterium]|nr:OmpA family protein [Gammaproteobacteria bacterium]
MSKPMQLIVASLFVLVLCVRIPSAAAEPVPVETTPTELGKIGLGGIIGALVAGPPGAIAGVAGGAWMAARDKRKDETIESLEARLEARGREVARLQRDFEAAQTHLVARAQAVAARGAEPGTTRAPLSLAVYFRTDDARIEQGLETHLTRLGAYLKATPELIVYLEGHADARGDERYNLGLSQRRVDAVRRALEAEGVAPARIREHAYGESRASAAESDGDAMAFDRAVVISVSIDSEA